ncbi:MAG TPA: pilus assembly protein TadG-related protein [Bryobacteraceae bacterium]|nr:pilus assembly protein TadG-related protein [Bryobacteraceae bacterium]
MKTASKHSGEKGQALLIVVLAMGIFLIGALGLAVDGAQMYGHRQMAQTAADAAAQAGILSIFNGTNGAGAAGFAATPGTSFVCAISDARTPCVYAASNGFGGTNADVVTVNFPNPPAAAVPGVTLSTSDPTSVIKVTVQRTLNTGLIRLLGPSTSTIQAAATAAIVDLFAPIPILITHPNLSGALSSNGNPSVTVCGGATRSIQVNSLSSTALTMSSNTTIDLSKAGPYDSLVNPCTTGTGADFGNHGGPAAYPFTFIPGIGKYVQPASVIVDPLANVPAPSAPSTIGVKVPLADGVSGCPSPSPKACYLYSPGLYTGGILVKNETAVFKPGLYYMDGGGFKNESNGLMLMGTGFASDPSTGAGMVVYNTGVGTFDVGSNADASLVGSDVTSIYKGILFFNDRNGPANTGIGGGADEHKFGGGGASTFKGTIYIHNTVAVMSDPTHFQRVLLQGNPGSTTKVIGEIIVNALQLGGNPAILMQLDATALLNVRQVALVR